MAKKHYVIPIFVPDLGCPHQCVFCNQKRITGQSAVPDAVEVQRKISGFLPHIPKAADITVEVAFYGGSFTAVAPEWQKELLKPAFEAMERGHIDHIRISTRPDAIDDDILATLSTYGVSIIELGVQSMDDTVLALANRGHTSRDVQQAAALIKSWGFTLGLQLMVGLPGDKSEITVHSCNEIIALRPEFVRIYPCLVLRDTELAGKYLQGNYRPWSLEEAVEVCKNLLIRFEQSDIPVIRIGLQPSEEISWSGDVIAGPYHPAFRELVESAVAREQMTQLLSKVRLQMGKVSQVSFLVPSTDLSLVKGQKNSNVEYFKQKHDIVTIITGNADIFERGYIQLNRANDREVNLVSTRKTMDV